MPHIETLDEFSSFDPPNVLFSGKERMNASSPFFYSFFKMQFDVSRNYEAKKVFFPLRRNTIHQEITGKLT